MGEAYYIIGLIIVFALVLLSYTSRSLEDTCMKGFWRADPQFCKNAELELFIMYIGDNTSYVGNTRHCYLLAANTEGLILNNPAIVRFGSSMKLLPGLSTRKNYRCSIDWQDNPPDDPNAFPDECSVEYYPKHGKLVFYDKDSILVTLWKDNQTSALAADDTLLPNGIGVADYATGEDI